MAFDSTIGGSDANSYNTAAEFNTHHVDRGGVESGDFEDAEIQVALVLGTDYIDKRFGTKFRSVRRSKSQSLEWPRLDAFDDDDFNYSGVDLIPRQLKRALNEYALIILQIGTLTPIPARPFSAIDPATGLVVTGVAGRAISVSEKVGPIEETTKYDAKLNDGVSHRTGAGGVVSIENIPEYPVADLWIKELLRSSLSRSLVRG